MRSDDPVLFPESQFPEKLLDTASAKDSPDLELFVSPGGHKVGLCATMIRRDDDSHSSNKGHGKYFFDVDIISLHTYLLRSVYHNYYNPWKRHLIYCLY